MNLYDMIELMKMMKFIDNDLVDIYRPNIMMSDIYGLFPALVIDDTSEDIYIDSDEDIELLIKDYDGDETECCEPINIIDVIYNNPATIVMWSDGTKTVVKCQNGDTYNPETGLAMCIIKKMFGNDSSYNDIFKKWLPKNFD